MIDKINVKKSKLNLLFAYNILFDFFYFISLKFI